jgi:hypothetical protein
VLTQYANQAQNATLVIAPIIGRAGWYTVRHNRRLLCRSMHPICDGARALRDSGYSPDTLIIVKNVGTGITTPTESIGVVARRTVNDMRFGTPGFRRWKAPSGDVLVRDATVAPVAPQPINVSEFLEAAE